MTPPLFHATLSGGLTGLLVTLGDTLVFTSPEDPQLYLVDAAQVVATVPVEPAMAGLLAATILDPRFLALTAQEQGAEA